MFKSIITAAIVIVSAGSAFANECGPRVHAGFDRAFGSETGAINGVTDEVREAYDNEVVTMWNDEFNNSSRNDTTFSIGIEFTLGSKRECERRAALENDLLMREAHTLEAEAEATRLEAEATIIEAAVASAERAVLEVEAEAARLETLAQKIEFCLSTAETYADLGKDVPASIKTVCGDLI